jgi:hypothetical protein
MKKPLFDREQYQQYITRSSHWKMLKRHVRRRANGKCERCHDAPMTATHHLTYDRMFDEDLSDLMAVCDDCHRFLHGHSKYDPAKCPTWGELEKELREWK